jgi:hypothetical protein
MVRQPMTARRSGASNVDLMTLKFSFEVKAVYSLLAALYIVKLLMVLYKLSTAAA